MEESKSWVIVKRFIRGFVAGGIASSIPLLAGIVDISDPTATKKTLIALGVAFITGGLQAIDKLIRWVEPVEPEPLTNEIEAPTKSATRSSKRKRATA
jgi:hypothetical protein